MSLKSFIILSQDFSYLLKVIFIFFFSHIWLLILVLCGPKLKGKFTSEEYIWDI